MPRAHVPTGTERPEGQRRMPRVEELPPSPAGSMVQAPRIEPRNARALFKRLASNVGFNLESLRDEAPKRQPAGTAASTMLPRVPPSRRGIPQAPPHPAAEGRAGTLDPHGRQACNTRQKNISRYLHFYANTASKAQF